ncbi:hypothetical protein DAIF1_34590 [Stenotrophomonas indicatrix]|nr:hypothetical protein DAIF1_34590 [Stenotrophomonas indicatrix]
MQLTPPPSPPTRPLTVSCGLHRRKRKKKSEKQRQQQQQQQQPRADGWGRIRFPLENGSDPFVLSDTPHPRTAWIHQPSSGNCRRRGGGRWRDRPRHGCRGRAYRDVLAACPASCRPPRQPGNNPEPLWLLQLLLQLQLPLRAPGSRPADHPCNCSRSRSSGTSQSRNTCTRCARCCRCGSNRVTGSGCAAYWGITSTSAPVCSSACTS